MSSISKIYQNSEENNPNKKIYDIGAKFENVYVNDSNGYTLAELYDYLKNFFSKGTFIMYSNTEPANQNVKIWFDTKVISQ